MPDSDWMLALALVMALRTIGILIRALLDATRRSGVTREGVER
jgi:hypothetical protein